MTQSGGVSDPGRAPVRLVFDAYWWSRGPTSLRHVLREIVFAWLRAFPEDEIVIVVRRRDRAELGDLPPGLLVATSRWRPQALLAARGVESVRRRLGYDAVITQNFAARSRGISAVYLHDVLFLTDPSWFTRKELAYFSFMPRWVGRADVVFASSATEARRIRSRTTAARVVPVGLGLSRELVEGVEREPVAGLDDGAFLLTVGRLNVRKNLSRTMDAALASGAATPSRPLVLVGSGDRAEFDAQDRYRRAIDDGSIRFTGHVSDAQLRWLYEHTTLFVYTSLGEGFGMPPVEARYFGAATLVSDLPVFRENLGEEASYVDPHDVEDIGRGMVEALQRPRTQHPSRMAERHDWDGTVQVMRAELLRERVGTTSTRTSRPSGDDS